MEPRLATTLIGTVVALTFGPPSSASCAGSSIEVVGQEESRRPVLAVGTTVSVDGRHFVDGCNDTGGGSACFPWDKEEVEEVEPFTDVVLVLRQGGHGWELGEVDAGTAEEGRLGWTTWTFLVPEDVKPGHAVLNAEGATLEVRLTR